MTDTIRIIELPKILYNRDKLWFVEQNQHIPFEMELTYWIYDISGDEFERIYAYKILQ